VKKTALTLVAAFGLIIMAVFAVAEIRALTPRSVHAQDEPATPGAQPEVTTALGRKFYSVSDTKGTIAAAQQALAADPKNVDLMMKLEAAQVGVWQDREAIATCTRVIAIAPTNAAAYVDRGHREVSLRQFDRAIQDSTHAGTLDPKNPELWYNLGLAHYFRFEFAPAAAAFRHAVEYAVDDDNRIGSTNWLYVSLRRANQPAEAAKALAAIGPEIKAKGPHYQFYLNMVRFYQGTMTEADLKLPEEPPANPDDELSFDTMTYQLGNWHLYNGHPAEAQKYFERVAKGKVWVTWGFIGSEMELVRARGAGKP
jgi:tetratricopeptide (TPR) repeat protein